MGLPYPNNASQFSQHTIFLRESRVTAEVLRKVFSVEADIVAGARTGVPLCIPYGLHKGYADTAVLNGDGDARDR